MRLAHRFILVGLASAAALAACSSDVDDGSSGGDGNDEPWWKPIPFEQYCEQYAVITCEATIRCECIAESDKSNCESHEFAQCVDEIQTAVDAGRKMYVADVAGECLKDIQGLLADCSLEFDEWPQACDEMIVGLVEEGGACDDDDECAGSLTCFEDACTALPTEGVPCIHAFACAVEHFCGPDGLCHPDRGIDDPCPEGELACADDLYCELASATCQPFLSSGESCAQVPWACDEFLYCSKVNPTCLPYPGPGGDCVDSNGACGSDLYCSEAGHCAPQQEAGTSCTEGQQCLSNACDGTCAPVEADIC